MKKRASIDKAEWSQTRGEHYRKYCEEMLLQNGQELEFVEDAVYLLSGEERRLIFQVDKPKTMWYEIWLKLRFPS